MINVKPQTEDMPEDISVALANFLSSLLDIICAISNKCASYKAPIIDITLTLLPISTTLLLVSHPPHTISTGHLCSLSIPIILFP